ncbi:MAG: rod shape-determining protein RodA [Spirochaetia bacterium]|nr:rod shape-determining protein RodA [Spirochaetia bacterium]
MTTVRIDWSMIFFALAASLIGVLTIYGGSTSGEVLAKRQLVWLAIGIIMMFAFAFINYQNLGSYASIIYGVGVLLLVITLIIGTEVKGAKSWLRIKGLGFQPAEFMKIALIIALSKYLSMREKKIANVNELVIPFLIAFFPMILIAIQPDLGYAILVIPILILMLFLAGANINILLGFVIVGFFTLFVPMFLEYHKYIIIDDIVQSLRTENIKLSDAVRILGFESWSYIEHPSNFSNIKPETLGWAKSTILKPENIELFKKSSEYIFDQNKSYVRDILSSDKIMIISIFIFSIIYGISTFFYYFFYRVNILKNFGIFTLIIALALMSSYSLRKLINFKPHQVIRIVSFANPDKFPKGAGYQLRHSIITIGSGKMFGKGFGQGDMTKGDVSFLPEWYNDFIFSVVGEQFGMFGCTIVLILLFGLVVRGMSITWRSKDQFGMLLASGITAELFLHVAINVGISMGLMPVTGIPLVLVSYGGSNMVFTYAGLGILLNIYMRRFTNI